MSMHYEIKIWNSNEVQVILRIDQKINRDLMIKVGETYWVQPDNPLKRKHRGKQCVVKGFIKDDLGTVEAAEVYLIGSKRSGKVEITDLVQELKEEPLRPYPDKIVQGPEPRYNRENVPDILFTDSELKQMGKVPIGEAEAFVVYADQKREFKLYNINATRDRKKQRNVGLRLTKTDYSIQEILDKRKRFNSGEN